MRKSALVLVLLLGPTLTACRPAASKDVPVTVYVDGKKRDVKPAAFQRGQIVYLPLLTTASEVKATVQYDKKKKAYTVTSGKKKTTIKESQGTKLEGKLMVPLSLITRALDWDVKWDKSAKEVRITQKKEPEPCPPGGT